MVEESGEDARIPEKPAMEEGKWCGEGEMEDTLHAGPWPPGTAHLTTSLMALPALLGLYALLKRAPRRLPLFLSLWASITTAVRRVVCCRCEFYGRDCSTLMGRWTAWLYPPDEENPLTPECFQLDFLLIGASFLYPLPQVRALGRRYLVAYLFSGVAGVAALRLLGCSRCPNLVCFMNPQGWKSGGGD